MSLSYLATSQIIYSFTGIWNMHPKYQKHNINLKNRRCGISCGFKIHKAEELKRDLIRLDAV